MSALLDTPRGTPMPAPRRRRSRVRTGAALFVTILALGLALMLGLHRFIPDLFGLALLIESALPWFGFAIPVLLVAALVTRSKGAVAAALIPAIVWAVTFVPAIVPLPAAEASPAATDAADADAAAAGTLTVATQNVEADSGTAAESATALAATGAQVIALQEMDADAREAVGAVLDESYPYDYGIGTVGVWSTYPIENAQALDLGLGWQRGIAADLSTPVGLISIYVVHAASARPGDHEARDTMLANLADYVPRDENSRLLMLGDFNAGSSDRTMSALTDRLSEANQTDGGFGFTWPASFPVTRPDHVLQRGMQVTANTTLRAGDSDHLAVLTTLTL